MPLPLDMPDDYLWLPGSGRSTVGDLGELAVRMGSPITYDRRGSVYWYDKFENGLAQWNAVISGVGGSAIISADYTLRSHYSAKLTAGSTIGHLVELQKFINPSILSNYGFEASFSIVSNIEKVDLEFQYQDGTIQYVGNLRADYINDRLQYLNSASTYVTLADDAALPQNPYFFTTMKLVIDVIDKNYVRAQLAQNEFDLTGIPLKTSALSSSSFIRSVIRATGEAGQNGVAYVDNAIITIGDY